MVVELSVTVTVTVWLLATVKMTVARLITTVIMGLHGAVYLAVRSTVAMKSTGALKLADRITMSHEKLSVTVTLTIIMELTVTGKRIRRRV